MKRRSSEQHARHWRAIEAEAAALRERGVMVFSPGEAFGLAEAGAVNVKAIQGAAIMARCEAIQLEYERRCAADRAPLQRSVR